MPGGSVNGRPFREAADAYSRTGIPCGNPKRYQSREVVKMGVQNQTVLSRPLTGPLEDIETEGERQLQTLLHKQLNTNITLKDHFSQHKRFSEAVSHRPSTDNLSGTFTLNQYRNESQLDQYVIELKHCGLTEEEIELKLDDMGMSPVKKRRLRVNLEPAIRLEKIDTINKKIMTKRKELEKIDKFSGTRAMGRHEMDLEKSISRNGSRAKLLNCLLTTSSNSSISVSDDPMDQLPEILAQMSERGKKTKTKRKNQQQVPEDKGTEERNKTDMSRWESLNITTGSEPDLDSSMPSKSGPNVNQINQRSPIATNSLADRTSDSFDKLTGGQSSDTFSNLQGCQTSKRSAEEQSSPRVLSSKIEEIPASDILENRLSVEEIKKLPRFQEYHPGVPSKVLYVKNLPVKVTEEELVGLFIRFQKNSQIIFRLLTGRMRGQAFITFKDEETAAEALNLLNGYLFKTKPVIIQFGRKQISNS